DVGSRAVLRSRLGHAASVEQDQGVVRTQAAHAEARERAAGGAGGLAERAVGVVDVVAQEVGNGKLAGNFDVRAADHRDRARSLDLGTLDAGAGDLDAIEGGRFFGGAVLGERNARSGDAHRAADEREADRVTELGGLQGHLSLQLSLGKSHGNLASGVKNDAKAGKVAADTTRPWREIKVSLTNRVRSVMPGKRPALGHVARQIRGQSDSMRSTRLANAAAHATRVVKSLDAKGSAYPASPPELRTGGGGCHVVF